MLRHPRSDSPGDRRLFGLAPGPLAAVMTFAGGALAGCAAGVDASAGHPGEDAGATGAGVAGTGAAGGAGGAGAAGGAAGARAMDGAAALTAGDARVHAEDATGAGGAARDGGAGDGAARADTARDAVGRDLGAPPSTDARPAAPCAVANPDCRRALDFGGCKLRYYRSYDLDGAHPTADRAVIAVHGVGRGDESQFTTVVRIARDAGRLDRTIIIAPLFPEAGEGEGPEDLIFSSYQSGGNGTCDRPDVRVSAFTVGDALVEKLADRERFPSLRDLVVIGHSGGGQFTGRYAAVTGAVQRHSHLRFKFVATNPSSWIFLNDLRKVEGRGWVRTGPEFDACRGYDNYQYGTRNLQNRPYVAALTADQIRDNWRSRHIIYFLGESDTCIPQPGAGNQCSSIDASCGAMLQGSNRLLRAQNFYESVRTHFPPAAGVVHELSTVPGVGHSSGGMYLSTAGRRHILE
jgi:hypothetical protein